MIAIVVVLPCSHVSTLGQSCTNGIRKFLCHISRGPDIDSKSSLLIRHHFFYLDVTASVDRPSAQGSGRNTRRTVARPGCSRGWYRENSCAAGDRPACADGVGS